MRPNYDYIIVGASPSGCVLANRLSANPRHSVLLLESGPTDRHPLITMPMGLGKLMGPKSPYFWRYQASPGGNRKPEFWFKGRTLGGSSSINGTVYTRGAPADYDGWAQAGCIGWGWEEIGRCFSELERHELGAAPYRGGNGLLHIGLAPKNDPLSNATIAAAGQLGVPLVEDVNGMESVNHGGFGLQTRNILRGRRFSAARAFLRPVMNRSNLDVVTGAEVLSIAFDGTRAKGVRLRHKDAESLVLANCETILSAGGINSPCLLQRSGIGPAALLKSLGIELVLDVPDVGRNLIDHRTLPIQYRVKRGGSNLGLKGKGLPWAALQYALLGKGPLAQSTFVAGGFIKTSPELARPDAQIGLGPFTSGPTGPSPFPAITIYGYTLRPESRGELAITSRDPAVPPRIDANYMATEYDRQNAVAIFRFIRKLAAQPALAPHILEELSPGADIKDDDDLLEASFRCGYTGFHVTGTCRMGSDDAAVLDPQLRVRGIGALRVVDASIMPALISGNTSGPCMAIGWRAAEMIIAAA